MKRILILIAIVMSSMNPTTLYSMEGFEVMEGAIEQELQADETHLTLEQRVAVLEQNQKQFVTHHEHVKLADGLVDKIRKFEERKSRGDAVHPLATDLEMINTDGLLDSDPADPEDKGTTNPGSSDPSLPADLPQASSSLSLNHPTIAGAIALGFHLVGGKDRVKQACGPFNEPTKKAVAQLVEGAVLANVFNATWPKISHGEARNSIAYTASFVAVHVAAKLLKPLVLQKLGMADSDSTVDDNSGTSNNSTNISDDLDLDGTDPEIKGLIKNLKNNIAWGQLLAEAAIAYALAPLLMSR